MRFAVRSAASSASASTRALGVYRGSVVARWIPAWLRGGAVTQRNSPDIFRGRLRAVRCTHGDPFLPHPCALFSEGWQADNVEGYSQRALRGSSLAECIAHVARFQPGVAQACARTSKTRARTHPSYRSTRSRAQRICMQKWSGVKWWETLGQETLVADGFTVRSNRPRAALSARCFAENASGGGSARRDCSVRGLACDDLALVFVVRGLKCVGQLR
jgi:hypothetical protein